MKPVATFNEIITEIRLSYPVSKGAVFILLEGQSDVKLYRKLFDENACKIFSVPGGKIKVEQALLELSEKYPLVIGIRDADFLHLEGKTVTIPNLFLTDYHDLEMTMVSNDETFSAVAFEYCTGNKSGHDKIRKQLLAAIHFIAGLRWCNESNGLQLNFEPTNFGDLYDHGTVSIDTTAYLERLVKHSPAVQNIPSEIIEQVDKIITAGHELYHLCNGHDFMKIMALYSSRTNGKEVTELHISSNFRTSYSIAHFKQTKLYKDTLAWAAANFKQIHHS